MGSSYQTCPCQVQVQCLRRGRRNLHKFCYFCFHLLAAIRATRLIFKRSVSLPLKGGSTGGPLQTPFGKAGAKASSVRNCERDYAGEPKKHCSRQGVGSCGSSSCTHRCIPTRRAFGFPNIRRGQAKRCLNKHAPSAAPERCPCPCRCWGRKLGKEFNTQSK